MGKQKNHINGDFVSGGHTTLVDGADAVLKRLSGFPWFESVRPGIITPVQNGKPAVAIRRHTNSLLRNTLKLVFRRPGAVQDIFLHVRGLQENREAIVADIMKTLQHQIRGVIIYDQSMRNAEPEAREDLSEAVRGAELLEKWQKRKQ